MAKRGMKAQSTGFEDEAKRVIESCAVLTAKDFSDSEDQKAKPITALNGEAKRDIEELAKQIHRCRSDKKWTSYQKRLACEQLVELAFLSTACVHKLAGEFPEPFREIAEELPHFPCLFPAHAEYLPSLQKLMWDDFNLGKRHALKLRAAPRRKTFSTKTWAKGLLIELIQLIHKIAREEHECDPLRTTTKAHFAMSRIMFHSLPKTRNNGSMQSGNCCCSVYRIQRRTRVFVSLSNAQA